MPHLKYTLPFVSLAMLALLSVPCFSQYKSIRFDRLTVEDGLPNPSVMDIMQDRQGFIWIGTLSGIVRYDGYEMKTYFLSASMQDSLPTRNIPNFYQDKSGNIWVGFQYDDISPKLYRYDARLDLFVPYLYDPNRKSSQIRAGISTMREDRLGRLLVGTWWEGLFAIDIKKGKEGIAPKDLPFLHLYPSAADTLLGRSNVIGKGWGEDSDGNFWMPTDDGLCKFIPGEDRFETYYFTTDTVDLANEFGVVHFEKPNTLWVGSAIHGLLIFNTKEKKFVQQYRHDPADPFSISPDAVWKIIKVKNGNYWLGVNGRMDIFNPATGKFTHIRDDDQNNMDDDFFAWNNALIEDYSGNIWAATWQQGIYKYNPGKGRFHLLRPDGKVLPGIKQLSAIFEDSEGYVWLASDGEGLVRWDRKNNTFRQFRHRAGDKSSLGSNLVSSMIQNPDGSFWVGTYNGLDLMEANGRVSRHFIPFQKDCSTNIHRAKNGSLWATSFSSNPGFCQLTDPANGTFKCYSSKMENLGGISGIVAMEEDSQGRLWLGINQWGFYIFDPVTEKFEHYAEAYGVHDIHFDRYGNTWLATHSAGLKLWDQEQKQILHLPKSVHDKIGITRDMLEDGQGFLWLNTPDGIVKFDPQARKVVQSFSRLQWMAKEEPWYSWGTCLKTQSGEMFFNSPSGVLYFHPDSLQTDSFPPKVALTDFRLFNKSIVPGEDSPLQIDISQTQEITLAHWQNDLSFVFAALHFKSPIENTYQYILENYDQEWRNNGTDRSANYTNLSPGNYTFKVKAANSDGVWGEPISLKITIHSPWWLSWWAILLYLVTMGSLLWGIRNYELNRQKAKAEAERLAELDTVKTKLYTNITHEFRTPLTVILGLADQLQAQANQGMKMSLGMIKRNGRQLLHLVNQILDLSKLESGFLTLNFKQGDVVAYLRYLTESFHSHAIQQNIEVHFVSGQEEIFMDFDPERLQQIVANLLSNAIKFTPGGGTVTVSVEEADQQMLLKVQDTGTGIPPEKLPKIFDRFYQADPSATRQGGGTGIGLALTKELVKLSGGEISVDSQPGEGTAFLVKLPIKREAALFSLSQLGEMDLALPLPSTPSGHLKAETKKASSKAPLVLLVEDNADVVAYLASCLDGEYRIAVATDGQQGINQALELVPDLIVSDVMMPEKDGFEVCDFLKNDERTSHIPIILLTAKVDEASKLTGLRRGADAYLAKPFNPAELRVRAAKLLELRQKLQAHYRKIAGMPQPVEQSAPATHQLTENVFLKKVRIAIEARLDDASLTIPDLATDLAMSRTQLHRKLAALTGLSPGQFVRNVRIEQSKAFLQDLTLNVSEVAFKVGFNDPDYFSKVFRETVGATPSAFRDGL
ncbi:MAG: ATP-binding protein [Saprospiraceae bacterium]